MATVMKYEDVNVEEDEATSGRIRTLMSLVAPKLPSMHLSGTKKGGETRANIALVHARCEKAVCKAAGTVLDAPMGGSDPMMVERILTSGGDVCR